MLLIATTSQKTIAELKSAYIEYYIDVPVQRYAALFIGRNEDTIIRWRKEDPNFAESVQRAYAEWIRKKVIASKAEFALERLEKEVFSPNATIKLEDNSYERFIRDNPVDPNTPKAKQLAEETLRILMEKTKVQPIITT